MNTRMVVLAAACTFVGSQSAFAQRFGDSLVVIDNAELKEGDKVLERLSRGLIVVVEEVKSERVIVSHVEHGWVATTQLKQPQEALEYFNKQVKTNPGDSGAYAARGNVLRTTWKLDEALKDYDTAIRLDSKNVSAYLDRASYWILKNEVDEAITDETTAIKIDPNNASAYEQRANDWFRKGDLDKASADVAAAIRLAPRFATAYYTRGSLRGNKRQLDQAIEDFSEAIRLNSYHLGAYQGRGWARSAKQQYEGAIADYSKLIEIAPRALGTRSARAGVWVAMGKYRRAVDDYLEEIALQPDDSSAYNDLAWLYATCRDSLFRNGLKAIEYATKACKLSEWKNAALLDTLAAGYAELGDFEAAGQWQAKARDLAPPNEKADFQSRVDLYKSRKPLREEAKK
jgi:tetratricopeptide (TPR) repeat protein